MLLKIGKNAQLRVVKLVDFGCYLDGGPFGEILLPKREMPENTQAEDELDVFIYCDSEDRLIATTLIPKAKVGELAFLEVVEVNDAGAFLDWGIPTKHLLVPYREQRVRMQVGRSYLVFLYVDEKTDRIVASSRLNRYLKSDANQYIEGQPVEIIVAQRTDLGFKVAVEGEYWGVVYQNELFQPIKVGDRMTAYVKKIRNDNKLDLSLQPQGYRAAIDPAADAILTKMKENNGFLPLTDKSPPALIYDVLAMSKKIFKKSVGKLYKQKAIRIEKDGIYLNP